MKALLRHPAVPPEVDADGVAEPLLTGPGRAPGQGVFRNIRERLPDENALPCSPWYGQLMTTPQTIAYFLQIGHWLRTYQVRLV